MNIRAIAVTAPVVIGLALAGFASAPAASAEDNATDMPFCIQYTIDGRYIRICLPTP